MTEVCILGDGGLTYGTVIDVFKECEQKFPGDAASLVRSLQKLDPALIVGRPGRLYDTISRIVAPTWPAICRNKAALQEIPLRTYRRRLWAPRTRNSHAKGTSVII